MTAYSDFGAVPSTMEALLETSAFAAVSSELGVPTCTAAAFGMRVAVLLGGILAGAARGEGQGGGGGPARQLLHVVLVVGGRSIRRAHG